MAIIILDSHLSTDEKIDIICRNNIDTNTYYLVYLSFLINDINKLLNTPFQSKITLVLTTNQSFKYDISNYLKLINKFNICYYNDILNLYYYNQIKEYNYLTASTNKLKFLKIEKDEHYFKRLIQDIENDNPNQEISVITNKNIDILENKDIKIKYLNNNEENDNQRK